MRPLLWLLLLPGALVAFGVVLAFFYLFASVPLPQDIDASATVVLDRSGTVTLAQLTPGYARTDVALAELDEHTIQAVLAAEDANFYEHRGVSATGILRAGWSFFREGGEVTQGGSTITQQYIKVHTGEDEVSLWRKLQEAALAIKLERSYSKDEILGFYLNSIYFGRGAYGIQAAAEAYFGADATNLTVDEAAFLAGLIPAPSRYDPAEDPVAADERYRYVVDRMLEEGWLDPLTAGRIRADPPRHLLPRENLLPDEAPFFLDLVRREVEQLDYGDSLYRGLQIRTTIDVGVQAAAEQAYADGFNAIEPTGALVALDPATGGVVALVGGESYGESQVNLTLTSRQPGSTFKPFALAAWLAAGGSPEDRFEAPAILELEGADAGADWVVDNFGGAAYGTLSLREATWRSANTVYAQVQAQVGAQRTADLANRLLGRTESPLPANASLVLGTEEVSPLELAGAYNVFAAGGVRRAPHAVVEVHRAGQLVYSASATEERLLDADVAATVSDVLTGVIEQGTGTAAAIGRPAAGKTGTTDRHADAWFAGYTPQLTAVVWMGNRDNNQPLPGEPTGGDLPAEVWAQFMAAAHEGLEVVDFPPSSHIGPIAPAPEVGAPTAPATATPTATATAEATATEATAEPTATSAATDPEVTEQPSPPPAPTAPPPPPSASPTPSPTPAPTARATAAATEPQAAPAATDEAVTRR